MRNKSEICKKLSDVDIIKMSIENVDYFACLYVRYEERLLRYINRIAALSSEEAEDILQESFIKIWKNLNDFDQDLKFSSWVYRIVHNETISYWRKKQSFGKQTNIEIDFDRVEADDENPDFEIEREKTIRLTNKILDSLPLKYKEVLVLKYFEKMSYEEISDVLKIPEGTVATRINRAKKSFRKISKNEKNSFDD